MTGFAGASAVGPGFSSPPHAAKRQAAIDNVTATGKRLILIVTPSGAIAVSPL
ncbi:hypothetical protein Hesp01_69980 [Herbidospora sp. NBRC 101105]|nr:hypothetical protein Hesp01_69980 [Herbidospora sp. NBRC 101105]